MTSAAIRATGLTKKFGQQVAVNGISLEVPKGSIYGFLGPNGSGKTTTIRMLLGLTTPTAGSIKVLDQEMPAARRQVLPKVGALVEGPAFYPYLSGEKNLLRYDSADPESDPKTRKARVAAALERVGLTAAATKKVHAYSLGMKQRLGIANALLQPRDLLVLDEPTNGLDPQGTREIRNLIRSLAEDGTTIFISSHLLSEIDQICSHVAVMSAGNVLIQGAIEELRGTGTEQLVLEVSDSARALELLAANGISVTSKTTTKPTLEERFVALTGEGFDVI